METTVQTAASTSQTVDLSALLHGVAFAPLHDTGWIRVTGGDRVRWLNGMVTNSIQDLTPGQGCFNFVLNAQGRIQGDLTAWMLEDSILLETDRAQIPALLTHLDHFIIMDDVELADISDQRSGVLIAGPAALRTVQQLGGSPCSSPQPATDLVPNLNLKQTEYRSAPVDLILAYSPLVPRFEIWAAPGTIAQIAAELVAIATASPQALEHLRILEGTPRYGTDIRDKDLPQETTQTRALHFSKGCYLGQEIVERIRSRGNVHRTFTGFTLSGPLPTTGAALQSEGKPVGELTSVAAIQLPASSGLIQLALGYVRREAIDRSQSLEYSGGSAMPVALPFPIS
jgi:folate-binding protein YgfZ